MAEFLGDRPMSRSDGITRRDFINGALVGAAGFAVNPLAAKGATAEIPPNNAGVCGDSAGGDPRFLRGGNAPSTFNVAHWLRDQRLKFEGDAAIVAPGCDATQGRFPIVDEPEPYDVVVVGAGLGGLSAAFYLKRRRPSVKILMIEANNYAGGNAAHDDQPPLPVRASACGAYSGSPDQDYMKEIYKETGVDWTRYPIHGPGDSYFFDEHTPGVKPGARSWQLDMLWSDDAIRQAPCDARIVADIIRCEKEFRRWAKVDGSPDEPPDASNPKYDYLSRMSFASYLTDVLHCDPRVVDFYQVYTVDCLGGTPHSVNAHTVISFLSSDHDALFAYPGGTSAIAEKILGWLKNEGGSDGAGRFGIELNAMALKVEADRAQPRAGAKVTYFQDGKFRRVAAKALVMAAQVQSAKHLVEPLVDAPTKVAWNEFNTAPAVIANVAIRDMSAFHKLGLGYANFYWGSQRWSNFIIADWTTERRKEPKRSSVLTFYGIITVPPDQFAAERMRLLTTPFADYEASIRDDLKRVMSGTGFDFDRDVSGVFIYRWGHSMILPTTKSIFGDTPGPGGKGLDRGKAPRHVARQPLGGRRARAVDDRGRLSVPRPVLAVAV